jgi:hypothetical protein
MLLLKKVLSLYDEFRLLFQVLLRQKQMVLHVLSFLKLYLTDRTIVVLIQVHNGWLPPWIATKATELEVKLQHSVYLLHNHL